MNDRVTLEDIAEASDASVASVSLALRNKPGVSRARRERILAAARSMGYARGMPVAQGAGVTIRNVGIMFRTSSAGRGGPLLDNFYSWVLTGVQEAAQEAGIQLLLGAMRCNDMGEVVELPPESYFDSVTDGVLLMGSYPEKTADRLLEVTMAQGRPVVLVDGTTAGTLVDCVASMNREGADAATTQLIEQGHSLIAFAGQLELNVPSFNERRFGYQDAMERHGLLPQLVSIAPDHDSVTQVDPDTLPFTAAVVENDYHACLLMRCLQQRGISVPDDVSLIGFDDTEHARTSQPTLTTMRVDTLSMGRLAVDTLRFRWKWPDTAPVKVALKPEMVQRASVRRLTSNS